jgi:hypothetical protein
MLQFEAASELDELFLITALLTNMLKHGTRLNKHTTIKNIIGSLAHTPYACKPQEHHWPANPPHQDAYKPEETSLRTDKTSTHFYKHRQHIYLPHMHAYMSQENRLQLAGQEGQGK